MRQAEFSTGMDGLAAGRKAKSIKANPLRWYAWVSFVTVAD
jgi:hypothetical protein